MDKEALEQIRVGVLAATDTNKTIDEAVEYIERELEQLGYRKPLDRPNPLTRKEIMALPIEERRKILEQQANNPEVIAYYESLEPKPNKPKVSQDELLLTPEEIMTAHEGEKCRDCGESIAKAQLAKVHRLDRPKLREKIVYYHELYERKCDLLNDYGLNCSGWQEFHQNKALQKYYDQSLALIIPKDKPPSLSDNPHPLIGYSKAFEQGKVAQREAGIKHYEED